MFDVNFPGKFNERVVVNKLGKMGVFNSTNASGRSSKCHSCENMNTFSDQEVAKYLRGRKKKKIKVKD